MPAKKMTSRKEQALQTKRKIFETATDLFIRKGYGSVTVDDICKEAGVSKGAFYHHFPSKDQILLDQFINIDSFYRQIHDKFLDDSSTIEKLRMMSEEALRYISNHGIEFVKVAYSSQLRLAKGVSPLVLNERYIYKYTRSMLKEGQEKGEFRKDIDLEERTRTIVSSQRGLIVEWCLKNGTFDLVEAGEDMIDSLLKGIVDKS